MNILLTGKNGQLGFELQRTLAPLGKVTAVDQQECNLAHAEDIRQLVRSVQPELIVNPAAYTAVDRAEAEPELAHAINAMAPSVLGEEAERLGAWVVHYSTDYVFDGEKAGAYLEDDPARPLNVYGASKREGETALARACGRHLILRTSWVVGAHGGNFARTILRLAAERDQLAIVADQIGAPTSAALLADVTALLVDRVARGGKEDFPFGLYHLTNSGATSWHEYACFVVERAAACGRHLKVRAADIKAITTAEYPLPAKRPKNSRLDSSLFTATFGLALPPWQQGLNHILTQILNP